MRLALCLALAGLIAGCGGKWEKGDTPRNTRETAPGAGLFTGETGEWRIAPPPRQEETEETPAQE